MNGKLQLGNFKSKAWKKEVKDGVFTYTGYTSFDFTEASGQYVQINWNERTLKIFRDFGDWEKFQDNYIINTATHKTTGKKIEFKAGEDFPDSQNKYEYEFTSKTIKATHTINSVSTEMHDATMDESAVQNYLRRNLAKKNEIWHDLDFYIIGQIFAIFNIPLISIYEGEGSQRINIFPIESKEFTERKDWNYQAQEHREIVTLKKETYLDYVKEFYGLEKAIEEFKFMLQWQKETLNPNKYLPRTREQESFLEGLCEDYLGRYLYGSDTKGPLPDNRKNKPIDPNVIVSLCPILKQYDARLIPFTNKVLLEIYKTHQLEGMKFEEKLPFLEEILSCTFLTYGSDPHESSLLLHSLCGENGQPIIRGVKLNPETILALCERMREKNNHIQRQQEELAKKDYYIAELERKLSEKASSSAQSPAK